MFSPRSPRGFALVALLLFTTLQLLAQTAPPKTPVTAAFVSGVVTTVSGNLVTIMNGAVAVDTTGATFRSRQGTASLADVKPGVRILASIANADAPLGATLKAAAVTILDLPDGTLSGPVQAVDTGGSTITLVGSKVQVTSSTKIGGERTDSAKTLADIKVGDLIVVEVKVIGSGLIAEQIHVLPRQPNASVSGVVKSIGADSWVITTRDGKDVTVKVNAQTKIEGSPKVGDTVQVIGINDASGNIVAVAIFVERPKPGVTLEGTVKSIGADSWVITTRDGKDVTVLVNAQTKIDPSVKVGDNVLVLGNNDGSGNIVALAIAKGRSSQPPPTLSSFDGVVKSIGDREWLIDTTRVLVSRETKIVGSPTVGDTVHVSGVRMPDGLFRAVSIEKK